MVSIQGVEDMIDQVFGQTDKENTMETESVEGVEKDKKAWWAMLDELYPVLDEYIDAYIRTIAPVKSLQAKYEDVGKDRTDANAISIYVLCHALWDCLPDSPGIHDLPKFHVLCDLCSESYIFFE